VEAGRGKFDEMVEATRIGTVIASDARAYARWRTRTGGPVRAATGADLERMLKGLAAAYPENVKVN
jgi:hypothetical protein